MYSYKETPSEKESKAYAKAQVDTYTPMVVEDEELPMMSRVIDRDDDAYIVYYISEPKNLIFRSKNFTHAFRVGIYGEVMIFGHFLAQSKD